MSEKAPHVKVTEVEGFTEWSRGRSGSEDFCIMAPHEIAHGFSEVLPDEAMPPSKRFEADARGPRGRFRITVEFWPEEKRCTCPPDHDLLLENCPVHGGK